MFKWKKSDEMAEGAAIFYSTLYFIFSLILLIYDGYIKHRVPSDFSFIRWLIIMVILSIIVKYVYYLFTAKDPKKLGEHYDL
jgi:divalent metal cation (Fe/Co/Zn/Cd) transporter